MSSQPLRLLPRMEQSSTFWCSNLYQPPRSAAADNHLFAIFALACGNRRFANADCATVVYPYVHDTNSSWIMLQTSKKQNGTPISVENGAIHAKFGCGDINMRVPSFLATCVVSQRYWRHFMKQSTWLPVQCAVNSYYSPPLGKMVPRRVFQSFVQANRKKHGVLSEGAEMESIRTLRKNSYLAFDNSCAQNCGKLANLDFKLSHYFDFDGNVNFLHAFCDLLSYVGLSTYICEEHAVLFIMPGLGRYPCNSCDYIAGNRRMLARHVVLMHSPKVFKCPLCSFITRYAANWYRHKRDLHGLTKITNCEVCGFFANSTAELAQHKETEHPEHLQLQKFEDKYAKERLRLSVKVEEEDPPLEPITVIEELDDHLQIDQCSEFQESNLEEETGTKAGNQDSITFSLPLNGLKSINDEFSANGGEDEKNPLKVVMNDAEQSSDKLGPLKVKRSYNCDPCGLLTSNPREYLYHLKNTHGERISVFECKYCIYASKHVQKLQRHCGLVHRQLIAKDPEYQKQLEAQKEKRIRPGMNRLGASILPNTSTGNSVFKASNPSDLNRPIRSKAQLPFRCSLCPYQTRNKGFLIHHEKTVHFKKRLYRCLQCGYVTHEKGRYTKHIKYHSLNKKQCEYCFFKTAYKWNMDRHMKNHENGAEGAFQCTACNFTTSTKQSFKSHVTNHHNNSSVEEFVDHSQDMNGENEDSGEWIDMEDAPDQTEENITSDESASVEPYNFTESRENSETVWKDGKAYQKTLQCKLCDFKAAWPFEMKKHEENHRSQKKHPCPLCGMRFEHIAWLTKHLRRVHQDTPQAKNIAAAFDLLKPTRRRPGKEYAADTVLPMFQEVLKQNNVANNKPQEPPKNSMLSTLLNKPLQPFASTSSNKFSVPYKSKAMASAVNMSRQLRISNYYEKNSTNEASSMATPSVKSKNVPTCNVCGYKTRWISELQRHMRVHSQEKPFHCPKCKYHCKWKGDLNRHLMKYHGIKVPSSNKKHVIPKLKLKKSSDIPNTSSDWQPVKQDPKRNNFASSNPVRNPNEDGPLDLTTKDTFPNPYASSDIYDPYDFENFSSTVDESILDVESISENESSNFKSPLQHLREVSFNVDESSNGSSSKRKYQCPYCSFGTTTASRFHVHIVQHFNRRPFMCSVCGYNSNWEWDITKHIRLKGCRDKFHNKACVLLTDESGRRNYEKYEKYLVDINEPPPTVFSRLPDANSIPDVDSRYNCNRPPHPEQTNKNCSYDFRNIGSNFEDTPENIVVTPDINIPDQSDIMDSQQSYYSNQSDIAEDASERSNESKCFFCKHCDFKHPTKRVVISHLSVHAGIKPFRCRACGITSNWRHVIVRHVKDAHNGYMNEVEDRISYVQEGFALRLTSINSNIQNIDASNSKTCAPQFGCKICPYKCDKEFYIKFHMKQHRPREGAIYRCDYCPYFVKFKKTLVRHLKLHNPAASDSMMNENMELEEMDNSLFEGQSDVDVNGGDIYSFYDSQAIDSPDDSIAISFDTLIQYSNSEIASPQKIKRHICESCPYKTDNKTQYLYHKQFHRPNPSAPFKCSALISKSEEMLFRVINDVTGITMALNVLTVITHRCKVENGEETLLFDDQEMLKEKSPDISQESKTKKKRKAEEYSERRKFRKSSADSVSLDSNSSDFISKPKVPVVVLSDILSDKDFRKYAPKLKIPKLKITKCTDSNSSEKIYSKINISYDSEDKLQTTWSKPKPSLVVKISKVENSNKNDKAVYSVSTKTVDISEHSTNMSVKKTDPVENITDSVLDNQDQSLQKSDSVLPVTVDTEAHIDSGVSNMEDSTKEAGNSASDIEPENDLEESRILDTSVDESDKKSEESFSSDTVPEVMSDVLCEKLVLSDLSFGKDIPLINGENDSHLTNGLNLLPGEIEVKL
ncbi:UNVERIFIED_CONTAM: zinc finger protein [Trichonephila clavipes]